ncbi:hypothetical protein H6777_03165 [Candidatus Nomurabacteria bacterium]|nr:hypothetical protein [Candidatus Kaiserbacteria bacterium]MCB9811112.1 hypothetical protein [Candidatus Nomurabacteria bacterium]
MKKLQINPKEIVVLCVLKGADWCKGFIDISETDYGEEADPDRGVEIPEVKLIVAPKDVRQAFAAALPGNENLFFLIPKDGQVSVFVLNNDGVSVYKT